MQANFAYELTINSEAFRAQGIESTVESGIGRNLFLRGGYTYLDAVVQRSFTNDDAALLGPIPTLRTAFRSAPIRRLKELAHFAARRHTGFFTATYAAKKITGVFTSAFASRSDDSTYLEGEDANGGNSLLLPNRNLDYGYAKLDLGGSYPAIQLARRLRPGRESARQSAHRAHRLSEPALQRSRRPAPSLGPGSGH